MHFLSYPDVAMTQNPLDLDVIDAECMKRRGPPAPESMPAVPHLRILVLLEWMAVCFVLILQESGGWQALTAWRRIACRVLHHFCEGCGFSLFHSRIKPQDPLFTLSFEGFTLLALSLEGPTLSNSTPCEAVIRISVPHSNN
jgi:hypothetical protein